MSEAKGKKATKRRQAVAYYRVSTVRQGQSGLGLEAQRASVESLCKARGYRLTGSYQDIESGKHNARPGLAAALATTKSAEAVLIIAKLDRLSRNASFTMALRDSGVDFIAADLPDANTLTIGILASVAQAEREAISTRTKAALEALKARGVKLGSPTNNLDDAARQKSGQSRRAAALAYHNGSLTHAVGYRAAGWTLAAIAEQLNKAGSTTRRGRRWTAKSVTRLLALADKK